jgi:cytochrome P450
LLTSSCQNYEFIKPSHFRDGLARILGVGILLAEGDEHKKQRKDLMPAFAFRHIKELYPVFWSKSRDLVERLAEASKATVPSSEKQVSSSQDPEKSAVDAVTHVPGAIEVGGWSSRATLDIIGEAGMGVDFESLKDPNNKLNGHYQNIFSLGTGRGKFWQIIGFFLPFWFLKNLPVKRNQEVVEAQQFIKQTCRDLIQTKRQAMEEKEGGVDIISVALESGGFTDEELVNQMMTFLVAGHETTSTSLIWGIFLLCRNPHIQTKLRAEIHARLPSLEGEITASDIDGCHYLHAVCLEIFRLWSPVTLTMRVAANDATLAGKFLPKGTTVILAPWAINTSTARWGPDALEFKPERWLDADGTANNRGGADSNYSFLTFLHGPRSCIGQKFAQAEFACLLAAWVGRFETEFEGGSANPLAEGEPEVAGGITSKPKGGLWVHLKGVEGW